MRWWCRLDISDTGVSMGKAAAKRYTEGGGNDYVSENAWYEGFKEGNDLKPDADPKFSREELAQAEKSFIDEQPPMGRT